jgi:hypothetical protein
VGNGHVESLKTGRRHIWRGWRFRTLPCGYLWSPSRRHSTTMTIALLPLRRLPDPTRFLRHNYSSFSQRVSLLGRDQCSNSFPRKWLSISRMLDLGGAPSSVSERNVARTVNASKNCKLQAVVFDLATLTRSIDDAPPAADAATPLSDLDAPPHPVSAAMPDTSKIESIANLLNVKLGGSSSDGGGAASRGSQLRDDLTLLTGERTPPATTTSPSSTGTGNDVRAKYASKLSSKGVGNIASVQLARQQAEESLKKGDAGGHWAARKMVSAPTATAATAGSSSPAATKWMARTGTGRLLQYLTQRSIRIALVPSKPDVKTASEGSDMAALQRQLHDVVFDALVPPDPESRATADAILSHAFRLLGREGGGGAQPQDPSRALLVSSREDYLREAKERGWMTCRVRPKNAPRGTVSTNYMVESVPDVRQVVDEINGISYSAVLNSR